MSGKDLEVTAEEKDIKVTVTSDLRPTQQCRESGEDSQRSAQPNTASTLLQGQENIHQALHPVCPPECGVKRPGMVAVDSRG